uniref:SUZ domain-containing protein n=1 Tax=Heterorhabditis bacteriophora TaxID=37862 RepID=A0A1I7XQJ5_HETBA
MAEDIVKIQEEKHYTAEQARKKITEKQSAEDRGVSDFLLIFTIFFSILIYSSWQLSPTFCAVTVTVRPPAVAASSEIVQSKMPFIIEVPQLQVSFIFEYAYYYSVDFSFTAFPCCTSTTTATAATATTTTTTAAAATTTAVACTRYSRTCGSKLRIMFKYLIIISVIIKSQGSLSTQSVGLPRRVASVGSGLPHMVQPANSQHNYVVVSSQEQSQGQRMQTFVPRSDSAQSPAQPVYRSLANASQAKRTPPATPANRVPLGYMTTSGQPSNSGGMYSAAASGTTMQTPSQRGCVVQRSAGRMFVQQTSASGERTYMVPHPQPQQIRMVSTQRLPQKRTIGASTTVSSITEIKQNDNNDGSFTNRTTRSANQSRSVCYSPPFPFLVMMRGYHQQGTRIMNLVMAGGNGQSLPMRPSSQPGGGSGHIPPGTHVVTTVSGSSGLGTTSVTRQLLTASRQMGTTSRGNSPQTVAQVVIAPPSQTQLAVETHSSSGSTTNQVHHVAVSMASTPSSSATSTTQQPPQVQQQP